MSKERYILRSLLLFAVLCLGTVARAMPIPLCGPRAPNCGLNEPSGEWEKWVSGAGLIAVPAAGIWMFRKKRGK